MTLNTFQTGVFLYLFPVWVILKPRKLKHIFASLHHVTIKENKMKVHGSFFRRIWNFYLFFLKKVVQAWVKNVSGCHPMSCSETEIGLLSNVHGARRHTRARRAGEAEPLRHMRNGLLLSHFKINLTKCFQQSHTQQAQTQK